VPTFKTEKVIVFADFREEKAVLDGEGMCETTKSLLCYLSHIM